MKDYGHDGPPYPTAQTSRQSRRHGMYDELEDLLIGAEELSDGIDDGVQTTEDGCTVEPDGVCSHGFPSPYRRLGII